MAIDYDSEALRRILGDLTSDDPEFVHSFEVEAAHQRSAHNEHPASSLVWMSVSITAGILAFALLMLGSFGDAMVLVAVTWFAAARGFRSIDNERNLGSG